MDPNEDYIRLWAGMECDHVSLLGHIVLLTANLSHSSPNLISSPQPTKLTPPRVSHLHTIKSFFFNFFSFCFIWNKSFVRKKKLTLCLDNTIWNMTFEFNKTYIKFYKYRKHHNSMFCYRN